MASHANKKRPRGPFLITADLSINGMRPGPSGPNSVHMQNTLVHNFPTPRSVLVLSRSALHQCQCSTHERHRRTCVSEMAWQLDRPSLRVNSTARSELHVLLRKEVIQPHLPVRLPCYDLVLITDPTFDGSFLTVRPPASGVTDFHDLTGGVYKARERIHRSVADLRLLATPTS